MLLHDPADLNRITGDDLRQDGAVEPALQRLRDTVHRHAWAGRRTTTVEGLTLFRADRARPGVATMYRPSLCVVAGGRKQVVLGDRIFDLDPGAFLIVTVEVPVTGCVIAASPDDPYLGLTLDLDPSHIAQLLLGQTPPPTSGARPGGSAAIATGLLDHRLSDALARLVELLDECVTSTALAPLIVHEIAYRLLSSEQGHLLRQMAAGDTHLAHIAEAADWIREHHAEPMRIDDLARRSAMGTTTFHRHFKSVTSLTPLEYRNRIRLQEARRLMLVEHLDATAIGLAVGYESVSQFSREYRRRFGDSPAADAARLRHEARGRQQDAVVD